MTLVLGRSSKNATTPKLTLRSNQVSHESSTGAHKSDIDALKAKWQMLINSTEIEIKVVRIEKSPTDGGLGIRLNGIQDHDDNGQPQVSYHGNRFMTFQLSQFELFQPIFPSIPYVTL